MHLKPQHGHLYQKKEKREKIGEKENTDYQAVRSTSTTTTTTSEERRTGESQCPRECSSQHHIRQKNHRKNGLLNCDRLQDPRKHDAGYNYSM
jgi:hypothetical protein